jgi:RNA polymerase sigma-70 factor (ECF subfamily)
LLSLKENRSISDLLKACIDTGNEEAWADFIGQFQPVIAATVCRTLASAGVDPAGKADDLVQEVYLRLCAKDCRALRTFQIHHEGSIYGFLKMVAYHAAQDFLRQRSLQEVQFPDVPSGDDASPFDVNGDAQQERAVLAREVEEALERVVSRETAARDKLIFRLYFTQGFTAKAISAIAAIGLSEKGVESTIVRLTKQIRAEMVQKSVAP